MQLTTFYHGHQLHRLAQHPDFYFFELAIWLHTLAHSLIAVFVPVLLLQSGYSITDVLIFYLIYNAVDVPLNFAADQLVRKIGARRVIILSTIVTIAFFALIGVLPPGNWPLIWLLAFLAAAYDTLFWIGHFYLFIEANRSGLDTGKTNGSLALVRKLAHIVGPIIGVLILAEPGKAALIAVSIVIFAVSIVPLFKMRHVRDLPQDKMIPFRKFIDSPQEKRDYVSLALWGIHGEVDGILWPLFIFTIFGTLESVAAVPVIVSLSTALFSYMAGKLTKKFGTRMIIVGCLVIAAMWILRLTLNSSAVYYATIFLVGIFSLLVAIPLDASVTSRGLKISSLAASTYRNTISMSLRAPLYAVLLLLVEVFRLSFGLAAFSLFIIVLVIVLLNSQVNRKSVFQS